MEKIPMLKIIQMLFTISIIVCGSGLFAFITTYAREYSFFPYGIFLFDSLWLWGIGILYAGLLSSFIAFPFVGILYANRKIDGCCKRCFVVCSCLFLIILYVFIGLSKGDAFNWRYFSFYLIGGRDNFFICFISRCRL